MNIYAKPDNSRIKFYENEKLQKIVDISLKYIDDKFFMDIRSLILAKPKPEKIKNTYLEKLAEKIKENLKREAKINEEKIECVNTILDIYKDKNVANLRGSFLELLTFKIFNSKSNLKEIKMDCFVYIDNVKSLKSVDVFVLTSNKVYVAECKLQAVGFKSEHIKNFNDLYTKTNGFISPYIITLAESWAIKRKLNNISNGNPENLNWDKIKIFCSDNFSSLLQET